MKVSENIISRESKYWEKVENFNWLEKDSILKIINLLRVEGDVLELCSGSGMFTRYILTDRIKSYTCLDISGKLLSTLKKEMPSVNIIKDDAENFKINKKFDCIVVFAGLHHLPHLREVLENSYSHLKKGGMFICFEPNRDCWYRTLMLPFRRILKIYT